MANMSASFLHALLLGALVLSCYCHEEREVHVVYMGERPSGGVSASSKMHHSILSDALGSSSSAKEALVYSYGRSFSGFAARMTKAEAEKIRDMEGVASVMTNTKYSIHTTRSWDFMGLTDGRTFRYPMEGDVVVGLLDTGIWPENPSFSDKGMGPPPAKWKGTCQSPDNFTCNNKIIGARFYNSEGIFEDDDFKSPRDSEGHGSHTASTAAGVEVPDTSYFGLANGTVRGGVPSARIAMYKVCWSDGCGLADILAAFDDAIADGVDIISVSLGGEPTAYFEDPIAIGSFHAMKRGILTVNSAGNSGPYPMSVTNTAPWTVTVAASTIDRKFITRVVLGNGQTFMGIAINRFNLITPFGGKGFPLIYGGDAANVSAGANDELASYCLGGAMNSYKVQNKIVLCDALVTGNGVLLANGLGAILTDPEAFDFAFSFPLPATIINQEDSAKILDYIRSTSNPIATILAGETLNDVMAPTIVSFSSRGPNPVDRDILKPDLTAPGVDILAAWSPVAPPSVSFIDKTRTNYNIISGTSMSCPHVSGAAAYVKSARPSWSPAAIKSALMTTATVMDSRKHKDAEFSYGSGHIDPIKAAQYAGLVFNATENDYVDFLCKQGYNTTTLRLVTGDTSTCPSAITIGKAWDLNYPSFALSITDGQPIWGVFHRTVTNVGFPNSTYYATVYVPSAAFRVTVTPSVLSFSSLGETKTFAVTVSGGAISQQAILSGCIMWADGTHVVRTPIAVYTVLPGLSSGTLMDAKIPRTFDGGALNHKINSVEGEGSLYRKNGILGHK